MAERRLSRPKHFIFAESFDIVRCKFKSGARPEHSNVEVQLNMVLAKVRTPCIGVCSASIGDDVCRGCKRFSHEVIDWNAYTESQRRTIAERLDSFLHQVVANKIRVADVDVLSRQLKHQNIRFDAHQDPHCWVFKLLKEGASQVKPSEYGLVLDPKWKSRSLVEIKDAIDKDYYALSCAYYDRYIAIGEAAKADD